MSSSACACDAARQFDPAARFLAGAGRCGIDLSIERQLNCMSGQRSEEMASRLGACVPGADCASCSAKQKAAQLQDLHGKPADPDAGRSIPAYTHRCGCRLRDDQFEPLLAAVRVERAQIQSEAPGVLQHAESRRSDRYGHPSVNTSNATTIALKEITSRMQPRRRCLESFRRQQLPETGGHAEAAMHRTGARLAGRRIVAPPVEARTAAPREFERTLPHTAPRE